MIELVNRSEYNKSKEINRINEQIWTLCNQTKWSEVNRICYKEIKKQRNEQPRRVIHSNTILCFNGIKRIDMLHHIVFGKIYNYPLLNKFKTDVYTTITRKQRKGESKGKYQQRKVRKQYCLK